jgi:hypothetical protein
LKEQFTKREFILKYENSQHIQYLTHENFELKNKLTEYETEAKNSNEKICNLEHCCTQLEIQLTETIKVKKNYRCFFWGFI